MATTKKAGEFGVRWVEADRSGRLVRRQRIFSDPAAQGSFCARLEQKDSFIRFEAWSETLGRIVSIPGSSR